MAEGLKKFGRYFLLDHLAQGGMAEIYRARLASPDGAGRLMVIKKIQAGFGSNAEFLQMFRSEIKVTMGFNHPNIVQLYDFGEEEGQPYIAMEWVDGRNLRQFVSRFVELKQTFPVELAACIAEQAASGLHYAHSFKDKITGVPYHIVHRDVSPQNVIISFEGSVKVIDFGIAKATINLESTRAGVIKGKPSYLSPEQIGGDVLDGRSDIFALGAVLWELLTGKKLFSGENDLAVLKLIESAQSHVKPPSTLNPKVPKELDYIVLRSLTKQREKRYQSAEELQRALHKFLYNYAPEFNPSDLSYYAKDLFKNEIIEDRKKIQKLNNQVEKLLAASMPLPKQALGSAKEVDFFQSSTASPLPNNASRSKVGESFKKLTPDEKEEAASSSGETDIMSQEVRKIQLSTPSSSQLKNYEKPNAFQSRSANLEKKSHAPQQRAEQIENESSLIWLRNLGIAVAVFLLLLFFGPEFGVRIPLVSDFFASFLSGDEARLFLKGSDPSAVISVNGKLVAHALPADLTGLQFGVPLRIEVSGAQGVFQQDVVLKKNESRSIPVTFGSANLSDNLSNSSNRNVGSLPQIRLKLLISPEGGRYTTLMLNDRGLRPEDPQAIVPLDTPLELIIERDGFKLLRRQFVVDSHQVKGLREWQVPVSLEPVNFGYLTIHTTPSADILIMIDGTEWKRKTPIDNEKIPVGKYTIRLVNELLNMGKTISVDIHDNKSVILDEHLEMLQGNSR